MNTSAEMAGNDASMAARAVSIYGQEDALEDFPVLKAFQQYIDAEQAKARKRMLILCVFFGVLMSIVISVFVILLMNVGAQNKALTDRLLDYAMKREQAPASPPVVVQPPQDNATLLAMTAKIDELQKKLVEDRAKSEMAEKAAAEKIATDARKAAAAKKAEADASELEIKRLKALLEAEKERNSLERERRRQEELEAYRRKHYPEFYSTRLRTAKKAEQPPAADDDLADEEDAISYFDDDESEEAPRPSRKKAAKKSPPENEYSIPVEIRGSSTRWNIPND